MSARETLERWVDSERRSGLSVTPESKAIRTVLAELEQAERERDEARAFAVRADEMRGAALSALGLMESDLHHAEARIAVLIEAGPMLLFCTCRSGLGTPCEWCQKWERAKGGAK